MKENEVILEAKGISKQYPGVLALNNVDLKFKKGKVHTIMGENGAGKSTLMKCLSGMINPTEGELYYKGDKVEFDSIKKSQELGIGMIHQELTPVLHRPVMENVWLNREPTNKFGLVNHKKMEKMTIELFERIGLEIDPHEKMKNLSIANIQMIEIAKAMSYELDVLIMDEPTSSITNAEVENLFELINELKSRGIAIIYISHKMDEIYKISDELSILRDGCYISTSDINEITKDQIIKKMVGRDVTNVFPKFNNLTNDVYFEVKNVTAKNKCCSNISFDVKKGEIFGIAGLIGAGRSEFINTLYGLYEREEGEIFVDGNKIDIKKPRDAIENGIYYLTEDRKESGIFPMLDIKSNISISNINKFKKKFGLIDNKEIAINSMEYKKEINIKTPNLETKISNLSGGNQQKVLVARSLLTNPNVLILDEPTRGVDVGAKEEIYKLINQLANQGKCIILISSELPEVMGLSDRILVMYEGKQQKIFTKEEINSDEIMKYASGLGENNE